MSEKRRALGRGLGALIPNAPTSPAPSRPVDVFFQDQRPTSTVERPHEPSSGTDDPDGDLGRPNAENEDGQVQNGSGASDSRTRRGTARTP